MESLEISRNGAFLKRLLQRCVQPVGHSCQVSRHWGKQLLKPLAQGSAADLMCYNQGPCVPGSKAPSATSQQPPASPELGSMIDTACIGELSQIPEQKCSCPVKMLGNAHSPTTALLLSASTEGSLCLLSTKSVFYQNWLLLKHWKTS